MFVDDYSHLRFHRERAENLMRQARLARLAAKAKRNRSSGNPLERASGGRTAWVRGYSATCCSAGTCVCGVGS